MKNKVEQLVYGTLLGDGYMGINGNCVNPRLQIRHSSKQRALVMAKHVLLGSLVKNQPKEVLNGGWGNLLLEFRTKATPEFLEVFLTCYPNGTKTVSESWLEKVDAEGLAWWFMDDGSRQKAGVGLSTEGFTNHEHAIIKAWFYSRWGLTAVIGRSKNGRFRLRFNKQSAVRFCKLIQRYTLPEMKYKLYSAKHRLCKVCKEEFLPHLLNQTHCPKKYCRNAMKQKLARKWYLKNRPAILRRCASYRSKKRKERTHAGS